MRLRAGRALARLAEHRARGRARHRAAEGHRGVQRLARVRDVDPGAISVAPRRSWRGQHDVAIAGGADSMSDVPLGVSKKLASALIDAQKAQDARRASCKRVHASSRRKDLRRPCRPRSREPTTGLTMGESAEKMAKENGITARRAGRDRAPLARERRARVEGRHLRGRGDARLSRRRTTRRSRKDNLVREDSTLESYAKLTPVFDRKHGTITAGNSSPLTDGASALLVMREDEGEGARLHAARLRPERGPTPRSIRAGSC